MFDDNPKRWGEFTPGMVHGVFGPSGSGKTTWFRQIIGLNQTPPLYPDVVAFLSQNPHLIPHETIRRQSLWFGRQESLERWAEVLSLSNPMLDRYPAELSGGEYQRAALLRVLVTERPVLLLDEPLSQIEDMLRRDVLAALRTYITELHPERLIILSSHHWDDLWLVADTLTVMEDRTKIGPNPIDSVYRNPPSPGMAKLFGYVSSIPCPDGGYWLVHPMSVVLGNHPGPGLTLQGTFCAERIGGTIRQWVFHGEDPQITLRIPGPSDIFGRYPDPRHIRIVDPPWVPYPLTSISREES